jgi:multiple antibiotic resistance protein
LDHVLGSQLGEGFYAFVALIALINPISTAAVFATLTEGRSPEEQAEIARRAAFVAAITLVAFAFVGEALLNALGVAIGAFKIAGGLLLLKVGFDTVFAEKTHRQAAADRARAAAAPEDDPSVFPLAIPIISGPGALTASLAFVNPTDSHHYLNGLTFTVVALLVVAINYAFMLGAERLTTRIGQTGIDAVSRIVGIIISAIAVELVVSGISSLTNFKLH